MGLTYRFINYHHGGKYSGMQTDMVLRKEQKVLYLDQEAVGRESESPGLAELLNPQS